jgi:hypothetical protein
MIDVFRVFRQHFLGYIMMPLAILALPALIYAGGRQNQPYARSWRGDEPIAIEKPDLKRRST